jgi:hypothetical protein
MRRSSSCCLSDHFGDLPRSLPLARSGSMRAHRAHRVCNGSLGLSVTIPRASEVHRSPSPGAVGPASRRRRRRYADAPAAALLTGLGAALGPACRLRRRYAHAPAGAFFRSAIGGWSPLRSHPCAVFVKVGSATRFSWGACGPQAVKAEPYGRKKPDRVVAALRPAPTPAFSGL